VLRRSRLPPGPNAGRSASRNLVAPGLGPRSGPAGARRAKLSGGAPTRPTRDESRYKSVFTAALEDELQDEFRKTRTAASSKKRRKSRFPE
jgi:hypothetical protein